jgi:hypothetical protein
MRVPFLGIVPAILVACVACVACVGCDGSWQWRDRTYALPEQAVAAQGKDLDREIEHVTKVLDEDRAPGIAVALLPRMPTLLRLSKARNAEEGVYRAGMAANEAKAGPKAANRAALFAKGCEVHEVDDPDDVAVTPEVLWVLQYLPSKQEGRLQWWLIGVEQGRYVAVPDVPATGEDRFDRFVDGLQEAIRKTRAGEGHEWPQGVVARLRGGQVWMPAATSEKDGALSTRFGGLFYVLGAERGIHADAQRQIGAIVQLLGKGGTVGPRVDLPVTAPATERARFFARYAGSALIAEVQTMPGGYAVVSVEGPEAALLMPGKTERDLQDADLGANVRRVLSSLRLDP